MLEQDIVRAQVELLRSWLDNARSLVAPGQQQPADDALAQLETAVEELSVSQEELRVQHEAIADISRSLDDERIRYGELFELAPDAYIVTDLHGAIREANQAAGLLFGMNRQRLAGKPLSLYVQQDDKPTYWEHLSTLAERSTLVEWAFTIVPRRGDAVPVLARARRSGARPQLLWLLRDLRERLRAEANERRLQRERAERESAERTAQHARFLFDAARALSAAISAEDVCRRACELATPTLATVAFLDELRPGREVRRFVHAGEGASPQLIEALAGAVPTLNADLASHVAASGTEVIPHLTEDLAGDIAPGAEDVMQALELGAAVMLPLRARGHTLGVLTLAAPDVEASCARDLILADAYAEIVALALDNARLLEDARASSRSKSDFIGFMSHEFRTPLTSILGYADLLDTETAGPLTEIQRRQLNRLRNGAWQLSRLVDEILLYSRESASPAALEMSMVDLRKLALECVRTLTPTAKERGIELVMHAPPGPLPVKTDAGRIQHIITNLLSNAVKFTDTGSVTLELGRSGDTVELVVRDTGIGIPEDQLDHIFEPFFQAHTSRGGGSGLGLSIVRQLAIRLSGELSVQSQVGAGTTFTFRLPATT